MRNYRDLLLFLIIFAGSIALVKTAVSAQSINTGDAKSETVVENVVNTNIIKCKECVSPSPTQPIATPTQIASSTPTQPAATPTPTKGEERKEEQSTNNVGGPSEEKKEEAKSKEVLGLSTTNGETNWAFQIAKLLPSLFLSMAAFSFFKKNENV